MASLNKELLKVNADVMSSQRHPLDGVRDGIAFVNGDTVGDSVTRIEDSTRCPSVRLKRQNGLHTHVEARHVEDLEHHLGCLLTVRLGIQWSFCEHDGVLLGRYFELAV